VANSVFRDGVRGLLGGKTTVLVLTSHYHLLSHADRILLMSDGSIIGDGSYDDIVAKFPHLMNMMPATKVTSFEDQEEQQEDDKKTAKSESTLVAKEDNVKGQISWTSYKSYLGASGYNAYLMAFALTMLYTISQVAQSMTDWVLDPYSRLWLGLRRFVRRVDGLSLRPLYVCALDCNPLLEELSFPRLAQWVACLTSHTSVWLPLVNTRVQGRSTTAVAAAIEIP
ncbi:hypothetical protein AeMF1_007632, partial [Aphanomyces euteiches]